MTVKEIYCILKSPLEEKLVRFLLLVYPDFLDQLLYFLLVELLEEPLCFVLVYPDFVLVDPDFVLVCPDFLPVDPDFVLVCLDFLPVDPDFVLVYPDFLPVVEPELLLPFEEDLEVSLSDSVDRKSVV